MLNYVLQKAQWPLTSVSAFKRRGAVSSVATPSNCTVSLFLIIFQAFAAGEVISSAFPGFYLFHFPLQFYCAVGEFLVQMFCNRPTLFDRGRRGTLNFSRRNQALASVRMQLCMTTRTRSVLNAGIGLPTPSIGLPVIQPQ